MALTKLQEFKRYQAMEVDRGRPRGVPAARHTSSELTRMDASTRRFFQARFNKLEAQMEEDAVVEADVQAFFAARDGKPKVQTQEDAESDRDVAAFFAARDGKPKPKPKHSNQHPDPSTPFGIAQGPPLGDLPEDFGVSAQSNAAVVEAEVEADVRAFFASRSRS